MIAVPSVQPSTSLPPMSMVTNATWPGWASRKASASPSCVPVAYEHPGPSIIDPVVAPEHPRFSRTRLADFLPLFLLPFLASFLASNFSMSAT